MDFFIHVRTERGKWEKDAYYYPYLIQAVKRAKELRVLDWHVFARVRDVDGHTIEEPLILAKNELEKM